MSFSNPQAKNPAQRFIQWRGGAENNGTKDEPDWVGGRLTWYDKENQEEVEIPLPFSFIVLDELTTLTGFNEGQMSGYWSNEVRDSNATLVARTKQGVQARGSYAKIKEMGLSGLKYAQSVYIAFKDETGELAIGNIKMAGAAMSAWIDFKKRFDIEQCAVYITDEPKQAKKGRNVYFIPVFEGQNINDETRKKVTALDEELQKYLTTYLRRKPEDDDADATDEDDGPTNDAPADSGAIKPEDIPDFDGDKKPAPKKEDVQIEDLDAKSAEEPEEAKPAAAKKETVAKKPSNLKDVEF